MEEHEGVLPDASLLPSLLRRGREEGGKSRVVTWRNSKIVLEGKKKRVLRKIAFFFSLLEEVLAGGWSGRVLNSRLGVLPGACS